MSRAVAFAFPGNLELKTGGYGYDRRVVAELRELGWDVRLLALGEGFPFPQDEVRSNAERLLSGLPDGALVIIDGLAFGVLDRWAAQEAKRLKIVALVHHALALETGLRDDQRTRFRQGEASALGFAAHVIVTSPETARELAENYGVGATHVSVAIPGTDPAPLAAGAGSPPHIVSIGSLTPRKGHDILLGALKLVESLPWKATIIGSKSLDPRTAAVVERQLDELRLGDRITLAGECEDARAMLATADIFALASRYEGYGMVFAEALSQGLPIVGCSAGAVPDVVPKAAGTLVPVDDVQAFADALRALLADPGLRRRSAEAARLAGAALPGWAATARIISDRLEMLA